MTDKVATDKVAVIGLGQMGAGMAAHLASCGLKVVGYDISEAARKAVVAHGVSPAASTKAAVRGCGVVLSSLPDPTAVRAAWLGAGGIVESAKPGSLLIELSTIDPATMRDVAAAAKGLAVVDCPVSGGPKDAWAGTLVLIVGAEPDVLQRAQPILAHLGASWQHTGGVGTAKVVKIVNNMMSMGNVLVAAEAFALGTNAGVDPQTLFAVLSKCGGRSFHFEKRFPNAIKGDFSPGFKMELGEKDLALAIDLGRQMKMPTPAASHARELYALALAEGFRGQDIVGLLALYNRWASQAAPAAAKP